MVLNKFGKDTTNLALQTFMSREMNKTYTDKQTAFLEALLGEARGDIRTAMTIAGYAKTTKTAEVVSSLTPSEAAGNRQRPSPYFRNSRRYCRVKAI